MFYDFIRIEWHQLPPSDKDSTKQSVLNLFNSTSNPTDARQISRIVGEIDAVFYEDGTSVQVSENFSRQFIWSIRLILTLRM